jgi:hypothetical protein
MGVKKPKSPNVAPATIVHMAMAIPPTAPAMRPPTTIRAPRLGGCVVGCRLTVPSGAIRASAIECSFLSSAFGLCPASPRSSRNRVIVIEL